MRVAWVTNIVAPYRVPVLRGLARALGAFRVFVSARSEPDRTWDVEWDGFDVTVQRNLSLRLRRRNPLGFVQEGVVHFPYSTWADLARFRPDVIVSNELGARSLLSAAYRLAHPRTRLVIHVDVAESTERGRGRARERVRRALIRRADRIVVNGASGRRYVEGLGADPRRIDAVPFTTDLRPFQRLDRTDPGHDDGGRTVLYVGSLIERKNVVAFAAELAAWCATRPDRRVRLRLVGSGPRLAELRSLPRPDNLTLDERGDVPYAALPGVFADAHLLALPTLADTWGLVVNEAMAAGLPVLGSELSQAVDELVRDGANGWRFDPTRPGEMRAAIGRALDADLPTLRRLGNEARRDIARLDADTVTAMFVDVLHRARSSA